MNKVELCGRLTRDPEVRYTQTEDGSLCIARYTIAVDRRRPQKDGSSAADFINCVCMGRGGEFAERWLKRGMKVIVVGHIQTGSYTDRDGKRIYTTDIIIEEQEFAESKAAAAASESRPVSQPVPETGDGFMNIPDDVEEEGLPFN